MALLDEMVKTIEQTGDQVIEEQGEIFSKQIKKYAQEFSDIIERDKKELIDYQKLLKSQSERVKEIRKAKEESTYEWRVLNEHRHLMDNKDIYRQIVTAALKFQTQINALLNQKVKLVYVYQDKKNNPTLYTIDQQTLSAILYYQENKGKIQGRFNQTKDFLSRLKNLTKYQLSEKFNIPYFNYTYKEIIWRFNYSHADPIKSDLIMWLNPKFGQNNQTKWLKAMVNKQGDIKQAYASIVLDRSINSIKTFNDEKLDNNVNSFMQEVAKVDNESGLLKGDVTIGQIEYAIKGVSASTLNLNQIITLAENIIEKTNYSKQDLQKQKEEFHKIAGTRNTIKNFSTKRQQDWQKELGKVIETKNKNNMNVLIQYQPSNISWFE